MNSVNNKSFIVVIEYTEGRWQNKNDNIFKSVCCAVIMSGMQINLRKLLCQR